MYETIHSPFKIRNLELKNRIVFAPTTMGLPETELTARLGAIAAGGAALVIIGDVPVLKSAFGKSLYNKKGFEYYQRLTAVVHRNGGKICAQLHMSDSSVKKMLKYVPGVLTKRISMEELRPLLNGTVSEYITELPTAKVKEITSAFGTAAELAVKAGFDMVQIHGDRMCGSFTSNIYNKRTDEYGGSPRNRMRFAEEAVRAVRQSVPELPVDFKLAVRQERPHYGSAGILVEELPEFIPLLGADSFHVALANHSDLEDTIPPANHTYFKGQGCFLKFCDEARAYTDLPLCGVGGLSDPDFVEDQLKSGRLQLAAMSRQLIADPAWPVKTAEGRISEIRRCIRCNKECLGGIQNHRGVGCIYDRLTERPNQPGR